MTKLNLVIISGSHRKSAESSKVVEYIKNFIQSDEKLKNDFETHPIFLADENLPFYSDDRSANEEKEFQNKWQPISQKLKEADAFVVVSPEWHGMVPAQLKNLFLLVHKELAYKPAVLVTVSAGMGGSYPINELRTSSYKNSKICYLPEHVIIRHVEDFNKNPHDAQFTEVRERLENTLCILSLYGTRLKGLSSEILNLAHTQKYQNGM